MKKYFLQNSLIIGLVFSFLTFPFISNAQTLPDLPVITTIVSAITSTNAEITINVEKFDSTLFPMKLSLVWGKVGGTPQTVSLDTESLTVADIPYTTTMVLDNLDPSTETVSSVYSYRIVRSSDSAPYTNILNFTTLKTSDDVVQIVALVKPATSTFNSATLNGVIKTTSDISDYNVSFEYINDDAYQVSEFTDKSYVESIAISSGNLDGNEKPVSASISALDPSTEYHYRLKLEGYQNKMTYSDEGIFTTKEAVTISPNPISGTTSADGSVSPSSSSTVTSSTSTTATGELIPCGTKANPAPCNGSEGWNNLMKLINNVINFIFVRLAIPIAAIMFAYAGFELLTSGGDVAKMTKAKSVFTNVAIGLIFVAASWLIVNTILTTLGYDGSWIGF